MIDRHNPPTVEGVLEELGEETVQEILARPGIRWTLAKWTDVCTGAFYGFRTFRKLAGLATVDHQTLAGWIHDHPALAASLEAWSSGGALTVARRVKGFSSDDPHTARWLLERIAEDDFGPPVKRTEITGEAPTVRVVLEQPDEDEDPDLVPLPGEEGEDGDDTP